uniref:Enoyl-CoA hydratase 1 n=1 Tax=Sarcophilus harrisii TaxID=9305 RepID=A0A7N4PW58_SARHA
MATGRLQRALTAGETRWRSDLSQHGRCALPPSNLFPSQFPSPLGPPVPPFPGLPGPPLPPLPPPPLAFLKFRVTDWVLALLSPQTQTWWPGQPPAAEPPEAGGPRPRNRPGPSRVTEAGGHVLHVQLNRPEKRNAMNRAFWREMVECFNKIAQDPGCRAVVISGAGKMFTSGIDLMDMAGDLLQPQGEDHARVSWNLRQLISRYQETFTVIEKVGLPAPGGGGGGPDPGGQRCGPGGGGRKGRRGGLTAPPPLPSLVNELAFTARKMMADEAADPGPVRPGVSGGSLLAAPWVWPGDSTNPVGAGTKQPVLAGPGVAEGLNFREPLPGLMLQTEDITKSVQASLEKKDLKGTFQT